MKYNYRAKKGPQDLVEGIIEAQNEKEAIDKLSAMGYLPLRISPQEASSRQEKELSGENLGNPRGKINPRQITILSRQLASLLRSGVPILKALNIIKEQSTNPRLRYILVGTHNAIKQGAAFSAALAKYPGAFPELYIAMVRAGEDAGTLPDILLRIADYRARQEEMLSRFRMSLAYPMLMAVVGAATVIFMLAFVMPRLMEIFLDLGEQLPLPTQILLSASRGIRQHWLWLSFVFVAAAYVLRRQAKTKAGKLSLSIFTLNFPLLGNLILKADLARFSRTLELLLKNGIPILKAIKIAIPVLENELLKNQLRFSYRQLEQGGSFGNSLKSSKALPLFMSNLVIVGEESGRLGEALAEVAAAYERDSEEAIRIITSLLEPLMILLMGLIVGFIVVAMLLPIFEISMIR